MFSRLDVPEYFPSGHDNYEALFTDKQIQAIAARQDNISVMFCGSGDARHFYTLLLDLGRGLKMGSDERIKKLHFTLVDIKPAALARVVIILHMLIRYVAMRFMKTEGHRDVLVVVAYLYTCQIIPPFVLEKLYQDLDCLIEALETDQHDLLPSLYIPPDTRRDILRVMKQWRHPVGSHYHVTRLRPSIRDYVKMRRLQAEAAFGSEVPVSKKDRKDFDSFGCLFADQDFFRRREPELATLYEACKSDGSRNCKQLEDYIDANWNVNVTLLDADHEVTISEDFAKIATYYDSGCEPWIVHDGQRMAHLGEFEPVKTLASIMPGIKKCSVLEGMGMFFDAISPTLVAFQEKLGIELVHGEMTNFMDRVCVGALQYRMVAPGSIEDLDPRTFPKTYDLIHLSNIP